MAFFSWVCSKNALKSANNYLIWLLFSLDSNRDQLKKKEGKTRIDLASHRIKGTYQHTL